MFSYDVIIISRKQLHKEQSIFVWHVTGKAGKTKIKVISQYIREVSFILVFFYTLLNVNDYFNNY